MRITGGLARSIQLKTLDVPELRPATDQMRQSIFNSIAAVVPDAHFLDLFAGSGAYGLEAISRGAMSGVFVERHPKLVKIIRDNLARVCKSATADPVNYKIRETDALKFEPAAGEFDLVFCDPPYAMIEENWQKIAAVARLALTPGGLWLMEHPAGLILPVPEDFELVKTLGGNGKLSPNVAVYRRL